MESKMKRWDWTGLLLVILVSISALWLFRDHIAQSPETEFRIVSLDDNALIISDADILSYNWTSQEIAQATNLKTRDSLSTLRKSTNCPTNEIAVR